MRLPRIAVALAAVLAAGPASAQFTNHGIAVESGMSRRLGGSGGPGATVAVTASAWLDGDVEAVARVAYGSADGTRGHAAVSAMTGTLGLRLSLWHGPVRPQVLVDAGWARVGEGGMTSDRAAFGVGVALEWFPASDLSVAPRAALRLAGGAPALELTVAFAAYF